MTTPDLERRLADLLQERAEGAMERADTEGTLTSLLVDGESTLRRRRRWAVAAGAVAAAAAVAVAVWLGGGAGDRADDPAPVTPPDDAVALATSFLRASYATHDVDGAERMLAPDAVVDDAPLPDWRSWAAWAEAAGFSLADHSCRPGTTSTTEITVHCEFGLHGLGSEELGRGPYGGNTYDVTIRDGKIVEAAEENPYLENGFSDEMWEPFAGWILTQHHDDVLVMYDDGSQTGARMTPRSFRLWEQRVAEYVDANR